MSRRFDRATARLYEFRDGDESRTIIALYSGGKRAGFAEIDTARRLAERIRELCDEHDAQEKGAT